MLIHNADITGSLTINGVPYNSGLFSGSSQVSFTGITNKPTLVSGSSQVTYSGLTGIPSGIVSGSSQVSFVGITNKPSLVSGSSQVSYSGIIGVPSGIVSGSSQVTYSGLTGIPSGLVSGSSQVSYSGITNKPSGIVSGSAQVLAFNVFATTGSNQFNGNQSITGSLIVSGQVIAQTLNVQQVTSSIVFSSGSNIFGNSLSNNHRFTGSVNITGSLTVNGVTTTLSEYVPYTGATKNVDLGIYDLDVANLNIDGAGSGGGALRLKQFEGSEANREGYSTISTLTSGVFYFTSATTAPNFKNFVLNPSGLTDNTIRTYTLPNASGTVALTSNLENYIQGFGDADSIPKFTGARSIVNSAIRDTTNTVVISKRVSVDNGASQAINFTPASGGTTNRIETTGTLPLAVITSGNSITLAAGGVTPQFTLTSAGLVTLTGALNGTSAVFKGVGIFNIPSGGNSESGIRIVAPISTTHFNWMIAAQQNVDASFEITPSTVVGGTTFTTPALRIASTGAATFSSSVTATGGTEIPNGQFYRARRSSSNLLIDLLGIESGTDNTRLLITGDFNIRNGSLVTLLNMTTSGVLTIGANTAGDSSPYSMSVLRNGTTSSPGTWLSTPAINITDIAGDGPSSVSNTNAILQLNLPRVGDADTFSNNAFFINCTNDNGSAFVVTGKRNVGILTNTPATALHVNGTALFSATSLSGNTQAGVYILDQNIYSLNGGNSRPLSIQAETLTFFTGFTYGERMRITSGGTIFNNQAVGTAGGGYSLIGTISAHNVGNGFLHVRFNTIQNMMVWIKVLGYSYVHGVIEGLGGSYMGGGTGGASSAFQTGSIVAQYQNNFFLEVVVSLGGAGTTTNRWGSNTFFGGTDTITTVQPLEIMAFSKTSTVDRVY